MSKEERDGAPPAGTGRLGRERWNTVSRNQKFRKKRMEESLKELEDWEEKDGTLPQGISSLGREGLECRLKELKHWVGRDDTSQRRRWERKRRNITWKITKKELKTGKKGMGHHV